MLRHYLLLAYRNFKRHKSSFFINWIGLSTGLACALLISLWVDDELSVDKFHETDKRLYEVMSNIPIGSDNILTIGATPGLLAQALLDDMPEVDEAAVIASPMGGRGTKGIISAGGSRIKANELYVSDNFFNVFSFQLIQGDEDLALSDKYAVLLSDELALKLFHTTEDIIGKTIVWERTNLAGPYVVSGIFEKPPSNSSIQFDLLFTYDAFFEKYASNLENWGNSNPATYLILKEGTDVERFNAKLRDYKKSKISRSGENPEWAGTLFVQRFSDRYLYNQYENGVLAGGRISYVKLFSVVALFILIIACVNFMNLSTAKASGRLREIGVKKAVGADRKVLLAQFFGESVIMAFLSLALAAVFVALSLPEFNRITGKHIGLNFNFQLILSFVGAALITGLISGCYPALYLSGFRPAMVLKGKLNISNRESGIRKGLVVFQFAISIILIGSVPVVYKQIAFIQTKNLGYNKDNIISFKREGKLNEGLEPFLSELKKIPGVVNASYIAQDLTGNYGSTSALEWEGKSPGERILFGNLEVGYDLIELMGLEILKGRAFSREYGSERSKIIFNESAIKAMELKNPIGKTVKLWGEEKQIIGVVKDFHFESLYEEVKPCFLQWYPDLRNILVKIKSGREKETIEQIGRLYQAYNEGLTFEYKFLDDDYQRLYASEQRVAILSRFFAGMAILISCLGLFGLASFTAQRRLKEIGIRKTLGSGEFGIIRLLSGEFTRMVLIAIFIGLPISYMITVRWLENFAYGIKLSWSYFAFAAFITLFVAWITVSLQIVKAALVNPAKILRTE